MACLTTAAEARTAVPADSLWTAPEHSQVDALNSDDLRSRSNAGATNVHNAAADAEAEARGLIEAEAQIKVQQHVEAAMAIFDSSTPSCYTLSWLPQPR